MNRRRTRRIRFRDERGVSVVITVVSLLGIFAAALLSLDFGSVWSARRQIITATDATALQQARVASLALNPTDCSTTPSWSDYLYRNANDIVSSSINCDLHPDSAHPGTGYVLVEARKNADTRFGGLFGLGGSQPYSLSAARYAFGAPTGLRPMGFCLDNAHVQQWIWYQNWLKVQRGGTANPNFGQISENAYNALKTGPVDAGRPPVKGTDYHVPYVSGDSVFFQPPPGTTAPEPRVDYPTSGPQLGSYATFGVVHRMWFTKDTLFEAGACGSTAPGNWGWIDYNGGENSNAESKDWVEEGYDGQSAANDCNNDGTLGDPCEGDTGSSGGSVQQELESLIDSQAVFYIPIFSGVQDPGGNAKFTIWGFLPLVLRGFDRTGSDSTRFFDFEFKDDIASSAGNVTNTDCLGCAKVVLICAVDHDGDTSDATIAARCGQ